MFRCSNIDVFSASCPIRLASSLSSSSSSSGSLLASESSSSEEPLLSSSTAEEDDEPDKESESADSEFQNLTHGPSRPCLPSLSLPRLPLLPRCALACLHVMLYQVYVEVLIDLLLLKSSYQAAPASNTLFGLSQACRNLPMGPAQGSLMPGPSLGSSLGRIARSPSAPPRFPALSPSF